MNKPSSHSQRLSNPAVDTITIRSQDFKGMIGLQLPKTAANYRAFWANPKNKKRVQSLLDCPQVTVVRLNLMSAWLFSKNALIQYLSETLLEVKLGQTGNIFW